ncbi:MAG: hypothetical protein LC664_13915 [Flavobacteriales bacterium]|nr:hypothetical protein [Flavobacteriales bacterium]
MKHKFTLKGKWDATKIVSVATLLISLFLLDASAQQTWEFNYTGSAQSLELPAGPYLLEVWGAEGGNRNASALGGKGGYAYGKITLAETQTVQLFVGEAGAATGSGSFNGGGAAGIDYGAGGGGATDIRTSPFDLNSRIIVAGGGGGASGGSTPSHGGAGGGSTGVNGNNGGSYTGGKGGTQSAGGAAGCCFGNASAGTFGQGAGPGDFHNAGGGGGWYGGGSGAAFSAGGGGSGYVLGLVDAELIAGNQSMPNPSGGTMVGKSANGYARITSLYSVSFVNSTHATCPESSDGFLSAEVTGGAPPYTFEWSNGIVTNSNDDSELSNNENLAPGDYTVTVTDANGRMISNTITIGPDPLEVSFDITQATSCDEISDGAATANVSGGTAPYTFSWDSGEDVAAISNKGIGSYTVTVTDDNECDPAIETVEITPDDNTAPVAEVKNIDVFLDADGNASIVAEDIDNGSTDDCAIASMSIDVSTFSCADMSAAPSFDGNTAMAFDGDDDYLEFDDVLPYSTNHTIAVWLKAAPGASGAVFTWGSPVVNNTTGLNLWFNSVRYSATQGAGTSTNITTSQVLHDGEWHHFVAVRNGDQVDMYVDGSHDVSGTVNVAVSNPTSTSLGGGLINGVYQGHLNAEMDEFAYWPTALSPEVIESMACTGPQGAEIFLDFETGEGTTAVADQSGNGNTATLENMDANTDWVSFGDAKELPFCPAGVKTTLSVTDAGGNVSEADAFVTVHDTISPTALARTQTIELDLNGNASAVAENFDDGSSDNCTIDGFVLDKSAFTCEDLGSNNIVLTVSDIHGNVRSVATQVFVEDKLAPNLLVQNIEVALDEDGLASISTDDVEVSASDNCAIASKSLDIEQFSCEDLGEVTVEMTVADASGNERTESLTVTVVDNIAPVASPQAYTIELDSDGLAELTSADVEQFIGGADTDDCSGILDGSHALSQMQFSCEELGENTVTYSVQDIAGNEGTAPVVITVADNTVPQAVAQNITVELDENGLANIDATDADNGSTDNCSIASREVSVSEFTCEDLGEHEVTLTVADASGNESETTFTVTVVDQVAPAIAENLTATVYLDAAGQGVFHTAPLLAQAADNCGLDAIVAQGDEAFTDVDGTAFSCEEVGVTSGPLFVRDNNGNVTEFDLELSVLDTIKPSLALDVYEMQLDADGNAVLTEAMLLPFASDNCGIAEVVPEVEQFNCSALGETQNIQINVIDINGNEKVQTLDVVIQDVIAPEAQVQNITLELDDEGQAVLDTEMLDVDVVENCTVNGMELIQTQFSCADLGENANSITVSDLAGNSVDAGFTVTVVDQLAPTINGPLVLTFCEGSTVTYADYVATDNCSATLAVIDGPQEGQKLTAGDYAVEFQAIDPSGNTASFFAMLEVNPLAVVDLGEDMVVAAGSEVTLVAGEENGNTYLWSDGETGATNQFIALEDVVVSVEVTTPDGCKSHDEIAITIDSELSIAEDSEGNEVRFFPNPTRDQISVQFSLNQMSEDPTLSVFD